MKNLLKELMMNGETWIYFKQNLSVDVDVKANFRLQVLIVVVIR